MSKHKTLEYDPLSLPTAQHRAGLAGLLLALKSMENKHLDMTPKATFRDDGTCVLTLTEQSTVALFNYVYEADLQEVQSKKRRSRGKGDKKVPVIAGRPLQGFGMPGIWLDLWRDAIWFTLRGIPKTRKPYEDRAGKKDTSEGPKAWKSLCGKKSADKVASCLFLGSQAANAEKIEFLGRAEHNFLLHFWPLASLVYQPVIMDRDGHEKNDGYLFVVPDVVDPKTFAEDYPDLLCNDLDPTESPTRRPRDAIVTVPQEGALEFMYHLARIGKSMVARNVKFRSSAAGMEIYHLKKKANNVVLLNTGLIRTDRSLLEDYQNIRKRYIHPLFRRQLVLNLLRGNPWFRGFSSIFDSHPRQLFVGRGRDGRYKGADGFGLDCRNRLKLAEDERKARGAMNPTSPVEELSERLRRLVSNYLDQKAWARCGIKWEDFKDRKRKDDKGKEHVDVPKNYAEAREKVAIQAFLRLRSCKSREDFLAYFTSTLCSVPQYLPPEEHQKLAQALLSQESWEDVKALTMLALSSAAKVG